MNRAERKAREHAREAVEVHNARPEDAERSYLTGYRAALEDAAALCEPCEGSGTIRYRYKRGATIVEEPAPCTRCRKLRALATAREEKNG